MHFGAGNIGRGFIGWLLLRQGIDVTFVDVNDRVVDAIKKRGSYTVELLSTPPQQELVQGAKALHSRTEEDLILALIQQADVITTSVGSQVLAQIAPLLAKGFDQRTSDQPLHVIACENALSASTQLQKDIAKHQQRPHPHVIYLNAAVDRIVPQQHHDDPLFVQVEPFFEWVVETKNDGLPIEGVRFVEDLTPYIERKLFTVNTAHCAIAYVAYHKGYNTIVQSLQDAAVLRFARDVLAETQQYLVHAHRLDATVHQGYIDQTLARFQNPRIVDDVTRVARGPLRKLSFEDRLVKPARELIAMNLTPSSLASAIAHGLAYAESSDPDALLIQTMLNEDVAKAITSITGLPSADRLHLLVLKAYQTLTTA